MDNLHEQDDYPNYMAEYYDKSTEREVLAEWVLDNSSKMIVSDFSSGKYSILDVGSPSGETSLKILSLIWRNLQPGITVSYRVVNAQSGVMEQFKNLVSSSKKREYKKMAFDWRAATFSDYINGKDGAEAATESVNLALFMQSIYSENMEATLVDCHNKDLANNGVIFCVVQDEGNIIVKLQSELSGKDYPKPKAVNVSTKDIVAIAEKNEWKYEVYSSEYMLDVSECLKEDSAKGDLLLDKLFNVKNMKKNCAPEVCDQIIKYLEKESGGSAGSHVLNEKLSIITLYK